MEAELESVRASAEAGEEIDARLDALEQSLADLRAGVESDQAGALGPDADAMPESGMQGAPNPLQDDERYLTGDDLLDADFPNSLPLPGTDNRFSIGGYVKLDVIQDLDYVGDREAFSLATIPVEGTAEAAPIGSTARISPAGYAGRT